jgi:hypothetical protein
VRPRSDADDGDDDHQFDQGKSPCCSTFHRSFLRSPGRRAAAEVAHEEYITGRSFHFPEEMLTNS